MENEGFVFNPYYKCTANKMINGKQCNIQWYVNDNKVTYVSEDVIAVVIDITKKCFEELVVSCGKKHTFLGMEIELVKDRKMNMGMKIYINEAIKNLGKKLQKE